MGWNYRKLMEAEGSGFLGVRIAMEKEKYQVTRPALLVARNNIAGHVGIPWTCKPSCDL